MIVETEELGRGVVLGVLPGRPKKKSMARRYKPTLTNAPVLDVGEVVTSNSKR